jgi:hypothetical protein
MALIMGLYLLTMSGHTYSPDEETILATSQALIAGGTWALPPSKALVEVTGADGRRYSQYGPGQPLAALPWVAAGRLAGGLFPRNQTGFPLRLVLGTYNALVTAGICALFAALGSALGYSRRSSLIGATTLGFATFLWPHSRTFFSEPLVALCLLASFYLMRNAEYGRTRPNSSPLRNSAFRIPHSVSLLSGVLFAAAVATKVQYAVALPAFLVYLGWRAFQAERPLNTVAAPHTREPPPGWTIPAHSAGSLHDDPSPAGLAKAPALRPLLWWLGGLILGLIPLCLYNLAIFGGALTTGYGADLQGTFRTPLYEGVVGLLLSPGKGLLWYAPPVLISVWAFSRFARSHRAEAAFVVVLALSLLTFFGLYTFWPGDGSWGPRYLVPLLPFALLPALSLFEGLKVERFDSLTSRRNVATFELFNLQTFKLLVLSTLIGMGFLVNALGALVNFDTYINIVKEDNVRYWYPDASPIVGHAGLLGRRVHEQVLALNPQPGSILFRDGFSYSEGDKARGDLLPRWTTGAGVLEIRPAGGRMPVSVTLRLVDHRPPPLPPAHVSVLVDGKPVQLPGSAGSERHLSIELPIALPGPSSVTVLSDTWNPSEGKASGRHEELGVMLESISVTQGSALLRYEMVEALPAPPYYPQPRWYYDPGTLHLADLWPVYMLEAGLGRGAMLGLSLPVILAGLGCVALGRRALSENRNQKSENRSEI